MFQTSLQEKAPKGKRKVTVTTNIAESSVTIPDVAFMIDTMREKPPEMGLNSITRLETHAISKNSAKQRMGGVGGTFAGECY